MKNFPLKYKITLWYATFLLAVLATFDLFLYLNISNQLYKSTENLIKADADQVESILQIEGSSIKLAEPYKIIATNTYFVIFDTQGNANLQGESLPEILNLPINSTSIQYTFIGKEEWAIYDKPIVNLSNEVIGWIRVSRSLSSILSTLDNLRLIMFISIPLYILLASVGGLFLARRALNPIDQITRTASSISRGDLNQRITLPPTEDEVGRLATTFNEMLDRLQSSFKKERQFASDASHELRTPTAIITAQAEQVLSGKRKLEEYNEALRNILSESKKMSFIISQLLLLYRSQEGMYQMNFETLDLNLIMEEIIKEYKSLKPVKNINLVFKSGDNIKMKADQTLITRMLINLIDNGIKYSKNDGEIDVEISRGEGKVKIIVSDNGIGIPEQEIPFIFDRFYQVNKSRNGSGTGLGLSLVKWIVEVHKGKIDVESKMGAGSKFIVTLPLGL